MVQEPSDKGNSGSQAFPVLYTCGSLTAEYLEDAANVKSTSSTVNQMV
jgi:hypothetical protein